MGLFDIFEPKTNAVVKTVTSKGLTTVPIDVTVGDIQRGFVLDSTGYRNEIVLFLRKDKKDRH
tara:strand:- start:527 stop:715 length:189 start_codon:yes stop_codon:yes gene_type:complete